ncbi:hypothetical protein PaG_06602 [Moesziomyces aphidis]|uniref:Uncharacterized protein n=1 Tax=Moesziomyces aphidis TaxID=84754 RepID=W3VDR4_MOEAP|nr:hypothetical protein PaG_06602 [Moesziomyces aphidis]
MKFSFRRHGTPRAQLEMAAEPGYRVCLGASDKDATSSRGRAGLRDIAARLHCRQPDEPETQPGPSLSTPRRGLSLPRRCPVEWQTGSLLVGFTEDLPVTGEQRSDSVSILACA